MNAKLLKIALPWLVLALLLPVLALSLTAGTVAGCPCERVTANLRVAVSPHGAGDVEVAGQMPYDYPVTRTVEAGQPVYLEAYPADGYYFVGWSGDLTGNENPTEIDIDADAEITAHFFPEEIVSEDSGLQIIFPAGTVVQDGYGELLIGLDIAVDEMPLPPPHEANIVGLPYDLGPHGATFDRPVTINFSYDPSQIPPRVAEEELLLAYYDDETAQWLVLPSAVDMASHNVTTLVDHLSIFAVIAPNPPPLPAAFTTSALTVSPLEVEIGETVAISVLVTNTGELEGSHSLTLVVNGLVVETTEITLAPGSQQVAFSTAGDEAGTYSVAVDGLEGSFTVLEAPLFPIVLPAAVMWVILGLALAALVVSAVIFPIVKMRRDYY
jgi:uncharacterized repeat protein (TIGR02543 family)